MCSGPGKLHWPQTWKGVAVESGEDRFSSSSSCPAWYVFAVGFWGTVCVLGIVTIDGFREQLTYISLRVPTTFSLALDFPRGLGSSVEANKIFSKLLPVFLLLTWSCTSLTLVATIDMSLCALLCTILLSSYHFLIQCKVKYILSLNLLDLPLLIMVLKTPL